MNRILYQHKNKKGIVVVACQLLKIIQSVNFSLPFLFEKNGVSFEIPPPPPKKKSVKSCKMVRMEQNIHFSEETGLEIFQNFFQWHEPKSY